MGNVGDLKPGPTLMTRTEALHKRPAVDGVLRAAAGWDAVARFGRTAVADAVRAAIGAARAARIPLAPGEAIAYALERLPGAGQPNLRPVFNLSGTVLHTNLGRALIAEEAVDAAVAAMRNAVALAFDLGGV